MEILNLGGAQESTPSSPKSRKPLRVLLGIGALAAVTGIGSTLAANISLNNDVGVEFGQGVVTTAACDANINVAPISTFDNTANPAVFELTSIELTDVGGECDGKYFTIKAYDDTSSTPLTIDAGQGDSWVVAATTGAMTITLDGSALAEDVFKITIESTDNNPEGV